MSPPSKDSADSYINTLFVVVSVPLLRCNKKRLFHASSKITRGTCSREGHWLIHPQVSLVHEELQAAEALVRGTTSSRLHVPGRVPGRTTTPGGMANLHPTT